MPRCAARDRVINSVLKARVAEGVQRHAPGVVGPGDPN